VLKLWVDCIPSPLLSFQAIELLKLKMVKAGDMMSQRGFLVSLLHNHLSRETAYVALYLSSFLHTMWQNALERQHTSLLTGDTPVNVPSPHRAAKKTPLTPSSAAQVFASCFIRPRIMTEEMHDIIPHAVSLVETLITCAEEPELWIGRRVPLPQSAPDDASDNSSDDLQFIIAHSTIAVEDESGGGAASSSGAPLASAFSGLGSSSSAFAASSSSGAGLANNDFTIRSA